MLPDLSIAPVTRLHQRVMSHPAKVMLALLALLLIIIIAFMTLEAKGSWHFVLNFRATKLVALALVGYAIAVSIK
jgi:iron complex transport system permease protein